MKAALLISCCVFTSSSAFQQGTLEYQRMNRVQNSYHFSTNRDSYTKRRVPLERNMKPASSTVENDSIIKNAERRKTSLSAATLQSIAPLEGRTLPPFTIAQDPNSEVLGTVSKVLSASLLVTGNTVGSSMFVLPDTVEKVGMVWGSAIFIGKKDARNVASCSRSSTNLTHQLIRFVNGRSLYVQSSLRLNDC